MLIFFCITTYPPPTTVMEEAALVEKLQILFDKYNWSQFAEAVPRSFSTSASEAANHIGSPRDATSKSTDMDFQSVLDLPGTVTKRTKRRVLSQTSDRDSSENLMSSLYNISVPSSPSSPLLGSHDTSLSSSSPPCDEKLKRATPSAPTPLTGQRTPSLNPHREITRPTPAENTFIIDLDSSSDSSSDASSESSLNMEDGGETELTDDHHSTASAANCATRERARETPSRGLSKSRTTVRLSKRQEERSDDDDDSDVAGADDKEHKENLTKEAVITPGKAFRRVILDDDDDDGDDHTRSHSDPLAKKTPPQSEYDFLDDLENSDDGGDDDNHGSSEEEDDGDDDLDEFISNSAGEDSYESEDLTDSSEDEGK